ncbi:hypothetical protein D3H66_24935 [Citrobacter portucalensis]|uniref:Uncharacterized protein n=1 Tax=Citrobacter portucalensis TaxID=1639133 RepID=A0A5B0SRQ0_9ENTR|nr:hypothetical protein D3H66_24935 [Citrobacter portucalensis]
MLLLSRSRRLVVCWRVGGLVPLSSTAGRGRTAAQIRPAFSQPPPPRQRSAAEPFPPSGAVLARSPDVALERDRRQGAHCCADTPRIQSATAAAPAFCC